MFKGSLVALVTPMKNGRVDDAALKKLINWHVESGTDGIVPCGTTGESATLSKEERMYIIDIMISQVAGRIPVIAGSGSNSTSEAVELTRSVKEAGADGALVVTPYYNKPTPEGLYQHFKKIAEEVDIPIIMYNVPGRTSVNMMPDTVIKLSGIKNIAGIKEASGSITQISKILEKCRPDFAVLSGDDVLTLPTLTLGGHGVISVTANILPGMVAELCDSFFAGDYKKAQSLHHKLRHINEVMFIETNPIPVKAAMALMGKVGDEIRLPLTQMSADNLKKLKEVMRNYRLL